MSLEKIREVVENQNKWRGKQTINLIASENIMLPEARELYCSDFMHRYAEGLPGARYYNGTKYIDEIEVMCVEHFKKHFGIEAVDVRPLSGSMANLAVFAALMKKKVVVTHSLIGGGHLTHNKQGFLKRLLGAGIHNIALNTQNPYKTDAHNLIRLIKLVEPDFIVLGKSLFLFEEPLKEVREECPDVTIVYDAAHVFGLVYQGVFQQDIFKYVDVITTSTHKTFPGPQGGLILCKTAEIYKKIEKYVFPGLISNHHLHRIPALLATAELLDTKYKWYGKQVVKNAKAFAKALDEYGFDVCAKDDGFTQTHQVVIDVSKFGDAYAIADKLETHDIIVNANALPIKDKKFKSVSGIRMGVQEMTLRGWKEKDFVALAKKIAEVIE